MRFSAILCFILLISAAAQSQAEGDRIIAIVGNDVILESDLNNQLIIFARQNNITQFSQEIIQQVFQSMLAEKLMLAKAEQDTIVVSEDEVQKQLDYRIKNLVDQFGSEKNLEETYGLTIGKIRSIIKEDLKKKLKVEKLKQQKFGGGIHITKSEVVNFYKQYKDSLQNVPETFELFQISRKPVLSEEARVIARKKAEELIDSIKNGADFSEIARKYSEDSASAVAGGDLGKVKKGALVKEFEDAAFLLKPGEISDVVETIYGCHIIKVTDKVGDNIFVKHILIRFPRLESADFEAINFLKDLREKTQGDLKKFKEFAKQYSQEQYSANDSGYIGKIGMDNLDSLEIKALKNLNKGDISDPVRVGDLQSYSYNMYFVNNRIPEHKATLENDYDLIEKFALNYKEAKELNEWLEELKKSIYVEIKI